jgi:photosystem II cytochrome c550
MVKNTTLVNLQQMNLVFLMKTKELYILNKNKFYITIFQRIVIFLTDLIRWLVITFLGGSLTVFLFLSEVKPVQALELDEDTRTVTLDPKGNTVVMTPEQVKRGKRLFNNACGTCHVGGLTKTNPNVGLDTESLSLATPPRDNISSLVAYMKEPLTYDGLDSISELHPSIKSADIFPKMRSLTDEDLFAIAGHILLQPKVVNEKWGGGKIYY